MPSCAPENELVSLITSLCCVLGKLRETSPGLHAKSYFTCCSIIKYSLGQREGERFSTATAWCLLSLSVTQQILMYLNINTYCKLLHAILSSSNKHDEASSCSLKTSVWLWLSTGRAGLVWLLPEGQRAPAMWSHLSLLPAPSFVGHSFAGMKRTPYKNKLVWGLPSYTRAYFPILLNLQHALN